MANIEEMDYFVLEQMLLERPLWMEFDPFVDDEGFYSQPQPQPHDAPLEDLLTYDTTTHSNAPLPSNVGEGALGCDLNFLSERQSEALGSTDFATLVAAQYDEAPTYSSMTAALRVNNNRSSTNNSSASPSRSSNSNKRKLEDHVGCFSIHSASEENRRKRQAFDPETRKDVALIRIVKPCLRCKIRKVKASVPPNFSCALHLMIFSANSLARVRHAGRPQRAPHSQSTFATGSPLWNSAMARRAVVETLPIT
jgi:hypothetical protein